MCIKNLVAIAQHWFGLKVVKKRMSKVHWSVKIFLENINLRKRKTTFAKFPIQNCCSTDGVKVRHTMWFRKLELQDPGRKCHGQIIREGEFKWQSDNSQGLKIGEYVLMREISQGERSEPWGSRD